MKGKANVYLRSILVLLILGDEILHVGFRLSELHLVHTLLGVPMQEGLALEHGRELVADTLEELLDGGRVSEESNSHLGCPWRNVTLSGEDVVGDPLDEVRRVLVLNVLHLLLDLLHGDAATEDSSDGEVATVPGVRCRHHVLSVEHLLGQLGDGDGAVLLAAPGGKRCETGHEEVETGERN